VPTLQTCASAAARAVADVPSAIAAAKHTDAQAKAKELIIIFVNFVFIVVLSFCCFGLFWLLTVRNHFGPFTFSSPDYGEKVSGNFAARGITRMSRMQRWVLKQKETKTAKTPFGSS